MIKKKVHKDLVIREARSKSKNLKWKAVEREQKKEGKFRKRFFFKGYLLLLILNVFQRLALQGGLLIQVGFLTEYNFIVM